jgi:hypothetical protein
LPETATQAIGRRSLLELVSMNQATEPVLPIVETPTGMYVVSKMRTVEGAGSVWVDAEFEYTKVAVTIAATVRTPPYWITRFIADLPSVCKGGLLSAEGLCGFSNRSQTACSA